VTPTLSRALFLSPSASHPRDYGNRNRVWQTASYLKRIGFEVHFLLYPIESDWSRAIPASADAMRKSWSSFSIIPPSKPLHRPAVGRYHEIDEWWDPRIGEYLAWLFARQHFDLFFVNYTFLSKAFEFAPFTTKKVLDTNDIFSDRREMLEAAGAEPEFFYTTISEERQAFERADVVLAIKDSEAAFIRKHSSKQVIALPYFPDDAETPLPSSRTLHAGLLRVGFVGALNTVNVLNMQRFLDSFREFERVFFPPLVIKVAGDVCSRLTRGRTVQLLGKVESIADYYDDVDVVVVPFMFSTGLKIKVAEALFFGKPVVATRNAFDGFQPTDEFHALTSYEDVCRAVIQLAFDRDRLAKLLDSSKLAAGLARARRDHGFKRLGDALQSTLSRILFVTDRAIWASDNLDSSRLAQWAAYCSGILPTVVIYTGDKKVPNVKPESLEALTIIAAPNATAGDIFRIVDTDLRGTEIAEIVLATSHTDAISMLQSLSTTFNAFSIDVWSSPKIYEKLMGRPAVSTVDMMCIEVVERKFVVTGISVLALRHLPTFLNNATLTASDSIIALLCAPTIEDLGWLEILKRRLSGKQTLMIAGHQSTERDLSEQELFEYMRQNGKPALLLAVGGELHMASLCQALARSLDIPFEQLSAEGLPHVRVSGQGRVMLCDTMEAEIQCIADEQLRNSISKKDASDGGWSNYWRLMHARRRSSTSPIRDTE
jgi:glycosyltransferase involved in cell wall biosynthesis